MVAPMPPRGPLTLVDWILLALPVIVAAIGVTLGTILRPHESLRDLGREISEPRGLRHEHSEALSRGGK